MKTYLICIVCILCSFQMTAQTSSYFLIEKLKSDRVISLKPKELILTEVERPYNNQYWIVKPKEMGIVFNSLVQQTFKGLKQEEISLLDGLSFVFFFDNTYKLVYYQYLFPKKHIGELKKIDKQLYDLAKKTKQIDLRL